ncbi:hypothetical protein [Pukyongiella litopenaei]|uniref:Uncharacterized protein n=1 Tax=Pukyongiella litopenaei TaxID=2605946 RepID=A0A2S0MKD3_9RHOB|nr:hypothetical protein [Pukyongiella litopenaei]AVO36345.1 hypothetical protein C6Y53_00545 [Pukyongiella litopenaei]
MNTDVYTGADGAILLSAPQTTEGEAAQEVLDAHELTAVGRVQDVRVEVTSDVRAYHEIGQRYASQLRPGNVNVRGTVGRAYVNGALIGLMLGQARGGRPGGNWVQPAMNITLRLANPSSGSLNTLTLHDVKLDTWVYSLPEDEFVMEKVGFQALYVTVAEE